MQQYAMYGKAVVCMYMPIQKIYMQKIDVRMKSYYLNFS